LEFSLLTGVEKLDRMKLLGPEEKRDVVPMISNGDLISPDTVESYDCTKYRTSKTEKQEQHISKSAFGSFYYSRNHTVRLPDESGQRIVVGTQ
jgi:hypothetical protein